MSERNPTRRNRIAVASYLPTDLEKKSREVLNSRGVQNECDLSVRRDGRWFVFDGNVDSESTKTELFSLVPRDEGARWIVDRLRTQAPYGTDRGHRRGGPSDV